MPNRLIRIVIIFLLFSQVVSARSYSRFQSDSLKRVAAARRHMLADSFKSNAVPVVFSLGYTDSLLDQIDHLHATLNKITNGSKYGFKTQQIENELKDMQSGINVIDESLGRDSTVLNISNLQMFQGLLKDMEAKLGEWRGSLYQNNSDLSKMVAEMREFAHDSFAQKIAADTAFAKLHLDETLILRDKWREAKKSTNSNLDHISQVMANVSTTYFNVTELENIVSNQLAGALNKTFGKEYNYIWNTHTVYKFNETTAITAESYQERMQILGYYLRLNVQDWAVILAIGLIFFIWVFRNYRKVRLTGEETPKDLSLTYIKPIAILSTLIFTLNIAPFYNFNQPAIYVELILLLLLIPLTILFSRIWKGSLLACWYMLAGFYLLTITINAIITPGWPLRILIMAVNVFAILYGLRFLKVYTKAMPLGHLIKWFIILFIAMHATAIFANISGRVTLGRILTSSAIKGLTQIIGLFVTVRILTEAFYLQMQGSRISGGMTTPFDYDEIRSGLYKLLSGGAILLWLITLATNLDIYPAILGFLDWALNTPRKIGSTSFTIGNILTFILVLYVVNILQQYIGYFFGEAESDNNSTADPDKNQSRLVIFRLIIIMAGFFIAVVASGLPVDKVTVVLGALGVGIGLGLQNIVYNLVSGLVLIFEKPMQIGDYVEVADKKGRVQSIGIRSSTLRTAEGSEIIVPNGDFLSTHMVNWTRSNDNRRTELTIGIEPASELQPAKDSILEELKANSFVIKDRPVEILLSNLTEKSVTLTVYVWINSIYKEQEFKSEIMSHIYDKLAAKGIKIV
jgi:potassium efflux system protein